MRIGVNLRLKSPFLVQHPSDPFEDLYSDTHKKIQRSDWIFLCPLLNEGFQFTDNFIHFLFRILTTEREANGGSV